MGVERDGYERVMSPHRDGHHEEPSRDVLARLWAWAFGTAMDAATSQNLKKLGLALILSFVFMLFELVRRSRPLPRATPRPTIAAN